MTVAGGDGLISKSKGLAHLHKDVCVLCELSITTEIKISLLVWPALYFQIVNPD